MKSVPPPTEEEELLVKLQGVMKCGVQFISSMQIRESLIQDSERQTRSGFVKVYEIRQGCRVKRVKNGTSVESTDCEIRRTRVNRREEERRKRPGQESVVCASS